jgi:acetyl-CoA/propionyl-CoA carboxylase biotin carboxyl carrier protein
VVDALGHHRFSIVSEERRELAYAVTEPGRTWVFIAGRTYIIEERPRDSGDAPKHDEQLLLSAPMPATVLAIEVAPGQKVQEGDLLIMLEAMKMELPVKAPRAGTVKSIACEEGALVQPGVPLLELE